MSLLVLFTVRVTGSRPPISYPIASCEAVYYVIVEGVGLRHLVHLPNRSGRSDRHDLVDSLVHGREVHRGLTPTPSRQYVHGQEGTSRLRGRLAVIDRLQLTPMVRGSARSMETPPPTLPPHHHYIYIYIMIDIHKS